MKRTAILCGLLVLWCGGPSSGEKAAVHNELTTGKFGKALDASRTPQAYAGDTRYRTPPLTVECWAKLDSKRNFNVLVSSDPKNSSRHWEIYSYAKSGVFSVYLPGFTPAEVKSKKNICDGQWHYLAMTFDGKLACLFVDGKEVHRQEVKPTGKLKPVDGPLSIGQAVEGSLRVGCDGLIDDVRISRVLRLIQSVPTAPLVVDADTVALWRFDGDDKILADPEWTPPPATTGEPWERMTDVDWVDGRLRKMDSGPTFNATFTYPLGKERITVYRGTAIRVGEKGEGAVLFDRNQLRMAAGWTGDFLNHSDRRFGLLNTPTPAGTLVFATPSGPSWAGPDKDWKSTHPSTLPLRDPWGRFHGHYRHGARTVLWCTINGTQVYDAPWMTMAGEERLLVRDLAIGEGKTDLRLDTGFVDGRVAVPTLPHRLISPTRSIYHATTGETSRVLGVIGNHTALPQASDERIRLLLRKSQSGQGLRLVFWSGPTRSATKVFEALEKLEGAGDVKALTRPGPARWGNPLVTKGEVAKNDAPYVVDTFTIPYENPHKALFFCTGLDFLPDGRIALCTCHGDVWLIAGVDDKLERLTWQRFATGLYQPLGLKVVDGKIIVLERGQLTRLHDTNNDGEADFYENLCSDWHIGSGEHSFDTCLETDPEGNFYFFKTGDTNLPHGGCLLRVSKDGKKVEVFATGFRHPIGLGVSPTGLVTGADQEGNWMPKTRVDIYKQGGFYGDMRAHHRTTPPSTYDGPLMWLPKHVDNSAGGQAWVTNDRFGLPRGQMLHLSYGRCKIYAVLRQQVGDVEQGAAADLGVRFLSGSARARFSPKDGHLYVCGLNGWQTAAKKDGSLQRMRYTGQALPMPVGWGAFTDGVRLTFAQKLDAKSAADLRKYSVEVCNYRWSADYGSKNWSVSQPGREGVDILAVESATLSKDGKSVLVKVKGMTAAMQVRIGYDILSEEGKRLQGAIHGTMHRLANDKRDP